MTAISSNELFNYECPWSLVKCTAIDTPDFEIFRQILGYLGIREKVEIWYNNYLKYRKQSFYVIGTNTTWLNK